MRWIETKLWLAVAVALAAGGAAGVVAQTVAGETGVLEGVVTDPEGSPLAAIHVAVRGPGVDRELETGPEGSWAVLGLAAGSYSVEVWGEGFSSAIAEEIGLDTGETLRLDFELAPGSGIAITVISSPRIDVASTSRVERLDPERVDLTPSWFRFSEAARLSVAITDLPTPPSGLEVGRERVRQLELRGAPLRAESVLVDGMPAGDPAAPPLELDAAEIERRQVEVGAGGRRPTFAGAEGGTIRLSAPSVATEGGRRWRLGLDGGGMLEGLGAPTREGGSLAPGAVERRPEGGRELGVSLGGSLLDSRLGLFAAVASRRSDLEQRLVDGGRVNERLDGQSATLRVTGAPTPRLRLALVGSTAEIEGDGLLSDVPRLPASALGLGGSGRRESEREAFTLDLGATDRLHLHAWVGHLERTRRDPAEAGGRRLFLNPSPGAEVGAAVGSREPGFATGKPGFAELGSSERDALRLQAAWMVGSSHRLTLGGELEREDVDLSRGLLGARTEVLWGAEAGATGTRYDLSSSLFGTIEREREALSFGDEWRLARRFTLQLGLRAESDRVAARDPAARGVRPAIDRGLGDALEPRLGLAWDVLGDGNYVIYLAADRFHRRVADALAVAALGSVFQSRSIATFTSPDDLLAPPSSSTQLRGLSGPLLVDPALEPERWDEVALGTEQLVIPGLTVRAEASYRELSRGVGVVFVDGSQVDGDRIGATGDGAVPVLANPGRGLARRPYGADGPEHPGASSRRLWLEMSADVRLGGRWSAGAGYAYTEGEGNADGAASPFENSASLAAFGAATGSADLLPSPSCAWLEACFAADGSSPSDRLLGDRRHRWKLYGSLALRPGLDLSAYFQYLSRDSPRSRIGVLSEHDGELAAVGSVVVPDVADGAVGDAVSQLDVEARWRIEKGPFAEEGRGLSIFLLITNLFDQDKALTRWNRLTLEPIVVPRQRIFEGFDALAVAEAQGVAADPRFGQPRLLQRAREARVGLRLTF